MADFVVCVANLSLTTSFWTSGTNTGPLSEDNHAWCALNEAIDKSTWPSSYWTSPWTNRCVALNLNSTSNILDDNLCSEKFHILCELY
jgi:hypothetical protein